MSEENAVSRLRQPLNNVGMAAQILTGYFDEHGILDDPILQMVEIITSNIKRLDVELVKEFTQLTTERDEARLEAAALRSAILAAIDMPPGMPHDPYNVLLAALSHPGPGREFGERVRRLEALYQAIRTNPRAFALFLNDYPHNALFVGIADAMAALEQNTEAGD